MSASNQGGKVTNAGQEKWSMRVDQRRLCAVEGAVMDDTLIASANAEHVAWVAAGRRFDMGGDHVVVEPSGGFRVVVDGSAGPVYKEILKDSLVLSQDGSHFAYAARKKKWLGGTACVVVHDGSEHQKYQAVSGLAMNRTGSQVAYVAKAPETYVVCGNQRFGPFDGATRPVFSSDGTHAAFPAKRSGHFEIFLDGRSIGQYDDCLHTSLTFSEDGGRFAFVAARSGRRFVVVDGREWKGYDSLLGAPVFSADGRRLTYVAKRGSKCCVVVDDREGSWYDAVGDPVFSRDGKHIAFPARVGAEWVVVEDGSEGPRFSGLAKASIRFNPGGTRLAYVAGWQGKLAVIVDGKPTKPYDVISTETLTFMPDGEELAHVAVETGGKVLREGGFLGTYHIVVGGVEKWSFPGFAEGSFAISPDGKTIVWAAPEQDEWCFYVNGESVGRHAAFLGRPFFENPKRPRYLAKTDEEIFTIAIELDSGA